MKTRYLFIGILLCFNLLVKAQPTEITYPGNLVAGGYLNNIPLASDGPFPIGFNFTFFGNSYSEFYVSANGMIMFVDPGGNYSTEADIPSAVLPNNYIAPFWDDLVIDGSGKILYTSVGASPNRKLIVQFKNMGFYPFPAFLGTFYVILYESSNIIQFQYRLIVDNSSTKAHGESATIGIENSDGSAGVKYAYHNPAAINARQAISFTPSGGTYVTDPDAVYDAVYLTTNINLPEPAITNLVSPPQDAVIGSDYTFQWVESSYAENYSLKISNYPDLTEAVSYDAGLNKTFDITGLITDTTYYWGVFASNATGLTWCEINRFKTSTTPELAPVPQTIWLQQQNDTIIKLLYSGGDASPKTAIITSLPAQGELYQFVSGAKGDLISSSPTPVSDAGMNVIYDATGTAGNGVANFNFRINDSGGDSPEGTVTINVNPPGVPNVLYLAKSTIVEIQFDIPMSDPAGKESQFTLTANGILVPAISATLKPGDPYTIILTPGASLTSPVLVSYTQGDVTATTGGSLSSFTGQLVSLTAQTITFTQSLDKKYSDSPVTLSSSASSGLPMAYSSSNLAVATISGNKATFHTVGNSKITARQAGNATYAPAKFIKLLTVAKGDQTITFDALPLKTYGDADFGPGATASSGLPVSYSSSNTLVATIVSNNIHITGGGNSVITASQAGNTIWNPAPDVQRTLTVNKAVATVSIISPAATYNGLPWSSTATTTPEGLSVDFTYNGSDAMPVDAGSYNVIATINDNNYQGTTSGTLNIDKASLTATADDKSKVYMDPNPELTYVITGFVNGETISVLDVLPDIETTADQDSPVGTYPVTLSGGNDNNYSFNFVEGTLTVTKKPQTITFSGYPEKLKVHDTYTLVATSTSELTVLFESMNEQIATVTDDQLTGVSKGDVQIRAYHPGDDNFDAAEALVTVRIYSNHKNIKHLFTPNNDGYNDYWELPDFETWGKCDVRVYNRWGKLVYADANYNNRWSGHSNGSPLPEGAYYFVIKTANSGVITGTVNIVR